MENTNANPEYALPEEMTFNLSDFALFLSVMRNKEAYENVTVQPAAKLSQNPAPSPTAKGLDSFRAQTCSYGLCSKCKDLH